MDDDDDDDEEHDGPGRHAAPPEDYCSLIYLALVLAGVGFLLPYNRWVCVQDEMEGVCRMWVALDRVWVAGDS